MSETLPRLAEIIRRTYSNAGVLLSGEAVSGVIGLANLAIAARVLGPDGFGVLILIHTYVVLVSALARFQSWQALIRYASEALENNRPREFQRLVLFTTCLDAGSGVAAIVLACAAAPWVGGWLGWDAGVVPYAMAYAFAAPFLMQATPNGVLWLFNRFRLQAVLVNVAPTIRLVGSAALFYTGGGLESFIVVWLVAGLCHGMAPWIAGGLTLAQQDLFPARPFGVGGIGKQYPGIWSYVISTNLSSSVKAARSRVSVLLIAAILGPAAGGFYRLAQDIASVLTRAGVMISQSIFPELSRLQATSHRGVFKGTVWWSGLISGVSALPFVLVAWLGGAELLHLVAGPEFREAAGLLLLVFVASAILLVGISLPPGLLAMGAAQRVLAAQVLMAAVQFAALWYLAPTLGLAGAGYALLLSNIVYVGVLAVMFGHATRSPKDTLRQA